MANGNLTSVVRCLYLAVAQPTANATARTQTRVCFGIRAFVRCLEWVTPQAIQDGLYVSDCQQLASVSMRFASRMAESATCNHRKCQNACRMAQYACRSSSHNELRDLRCNGCALSFPQHRPHRPELQAEQTPPFHRICPSPCLRRQYRLSQHSQTVASGFSCAT